MKRLISITAIMLLAILLSCKPKDQKENVSDVATLSCIKMDAPRGIPPVLKSEARCAPPKLKGDEVYSEVVLDNAISNIKNNVVKKKIIKDGNISIRVTDVEKTKKSIDDILKKYNAYYENESFENGDSRLSYDLEIRIPSNCFEAFLSSVENGTGEVESKNISARDVTEEFVDVESRLNSKKLYLKRYTDILSKASSVKDILNVQENIRILQEEIESQEGRLKYLNDQVDFSTLNLNIYKQKEYSFKPNVQDSIVERLKKSLSNGWQSIIDSMLWIISLWPLLIVVLLLAYFIRRFIKKRRNK